MLPFDPAMRAVAIIPAYQATRTVGAIVAELCARWPESAGRPAVIVVDDGSSDGTAETAHRAGADVVRHAKNRGKGAALRSGLQRAAELGAELAVSVDADAQHPPEEAVRLLDYPAPMSALVLGIRDLVRDGAPRANRFSNGFSNAWISMFSGRRLVDTQCGLRRYPVCSTLELGVKACGYGFEAEVILRAARARWPIAEVPVRVVYPVNGQHTSHFHVVRDPARIVARILWTVATAPRSR